MDQSNDRQLPIRQEFSFCVHPLDSAPKLYDSVAVPGGGGEAGAGSGSDVTAVLVSLAVTVDSAVLFSTAEVRVVGCGVSLQGVEVADVVAVLMGVVGVPRVIRACPDARCTTSASANIALSGRPRGPTTATRARVWCLPLGRVGPAPERAGPPVLQPSGGKAASDAEPARGGL